MSGQQEEPPFEWDVPFEWPDNWVPVGATTESKPRFVRWRPRTHQQCAECVREIHRAKGVAPRPQPVRWKVTRGGVTENMCEQHKTEVAGPS